MGADIAVVSVTEDRDIIEKDIRSLESKLVQPAVFGYHMF